MSKLNRVFNVWRGQLLSLMYHPVYFFVIGSDGAAKTPYTLLSPDLEERETAMQSMSSTFDIEQCRWDYLMDKAAVVFE